MDTERVDRLSGKFAKAINEEIGATSLEVCAALCDMIKQILSQAPRQATAVQLRDLCIAEIRTSVGLKS